MTELLLRLSVLKSSFQLTRRLLIVLKRNVALVFIVFIRVRVLQWIIMASLTYLCFVPAKGLIRDLSANSSNFAFEVPLASK